MSKKSSEKPSMKETTKRRRFTAEFKTDAVQMLFDGHSVSSVCERLGLSSPNLLYRWKQELVHKDGPAAVGLEARVRELEAELRRVERERDILKKALSIFGRDG
jgi:transposase